MTWESRTDVPEERLEVKRYWPILESPQHSPPHRPASAPETGNSGDPAHLRILEDLNDQATPSDETHLQQEMSLLRTPSAIGYRTRPCS